MSLASRLAALERAASALRALPAQCPTCSHPRPDAAGIAVTFDGAFPFRCGTCGEPVGETGKALTRVDPDGRHRLNVLEVADATEEERAILISGWIPRD